MSCGIVGTLIAFQCTDEAVDMDVEVSAMIDLSDVLLE
jgi:hypothetical protein